MAKKYKNANQPMLKTLSDSFMILSFALTLALLLIYGFTKRLFIWLIALSSFSWFALSGIFLFVLLTDKSVLIKKDAFYKGKPISQKEAAFFGYVYAGIFWRLAQYLPSCFSENSVVNSLAKYSLLPYAHAGKVTCFERIR